MEPVPELIQVVWPDSNQDGSFTISREIAIDLAMLLTELRTYIEIQYARCSE
jgi:hypothetical protein